MSCELELARFQAEDAASRTGNEHFVVEDARGRCHVTVEPHRDAMYIAQPKQDAAARTAARDLSSSPWSA